MPLATRRRVGCNRPLSHGVPSRLRALTIDRRGNRHRVTSRQGFYRTRSKQKIIPSDRKSFSDLFQISQRERTERQIGSLDHRVHNNGVQITVAGHHRTQIVIAWS